MIPPHDEDPNGPTPLCYNTNAQWITQTGVCRTNTGSSCQVYDQYNRQRSSLDGEVSTPFYAAGITGDGEVIQVSDTGLDQDNQMFWDSGCLVTPSKTGEVKNIRGPETNPLNPLNSSNPVPGFNQP